MKRRIENDQSTPCKKQKTAETPSISSLPDELRQQIASLLTYKAGNALRNTASFFASDEVIGKAIFKTFIQEHVLDYNDEKELADFFTRLKELTGGERQPPGTAQLYQAYAMTLNKTKDMLRDLNNSSNLNVNFDLRLKDTLFFACREGNIAILELFKTLAPYLLGEIINEKENYFEEEKMTALGVAAANGRKRIFSWLLENKATLVVGESVLYDNDHLMYYDLGHDFWAAMTPLHIIALRSDADWLSTIFALQYSFRSVFSENYKNCLENIINNKPEELKALLKEIPSLLPEMDTAEWTLLHWATSLGRIDCMKVLIENNVDVNCMSGGLSPLFLASATGNLMAIQELIEAEATIEPFVANNSTCLHLTASNGHKECTRYFIRECGMDINEVNDNGETPLDLAQLRVDSDESPLSFQKIANKAECAELLIELGAENGENNRPAL